MRLPFSLWLLLGAFVVGCGPETASEPVDGSSDANSAPVPTQEPADGQAPSIADRPSQTAQDAERDVAAELAALNYADRVSEQLRVEADDQVWITSRIPDGTREASYDHGCGLGDFEGEYPTEVICTVEYGEVLLLDADGQISRAFPMPGAPPDWLEVTADAVYTGRIGDGGLPWSSLAKIDRTTLDIDVVVFPTGLVDPTEGNTWLPSWRFGTRDQLPLLDELGDGTFDPSTADRLLTAT